MLSNLPRRAAFATHGIHVLDGFFEAGVPSTLMAQEACVFNPDKRIDCTGLFCPMPIVKTREAIKQIARGQLLEMLSDDPASLADMKSWAQITRHELVAVERDGGVFRFLVRKA